MKSFRKTLNKFEYSVGTEFEATLDLRWVATSNYTEVDEPIELAEGEQATNDSYYSLPPGETEISIVYDVTGLADFRGRARVFGQRDFWPRGNRE